MFTIEPAALVRMLAAAGLGVSDSPPHHDVVCLKASQDRLRFELNGACSEANAIVWQDGQCRISTASLSEVLKRFRFESTVTVDVQYGWLRIRHAAVPVLGFCAWTATSEAGHSDFDTD